MDMRPARLYSRSVAISFLFIINDLPKTVIQRLEVNNFF